MKRMYALGCVIVALLAGAYTLRSQDMFPVRQLTSDSSREGFPSWSPDGKTIVYSIVDFVNGKPVFGLRKISPDGGLALPFTDYICEHPQWSPDGRFIVFDSDSGAGMRLIEAEGGSPKKFIPDSIRIYNGGLPCWSPSGTQIAFKDSGGSLWVYSLTTGIAEKLFQKEGFNPLPGCWTRDGKGVLIALMDRKTRLSTVLNISVDSKEQRQLAGHCDSLYRYLALSPDGSLLVYGAMQGKRVGLWIMPAGGGKSLPLVVSDNHHNESPAWSPDGKRILFASRRTGRGDIYIMDLDIEKVKAELK